VTHYAYADDTQLACAAYLPELNTAKSHLEADFNNVAQWSACSLKLNATKTEYFICHSNAMLPPALPLRLGSCNASPKDTVKLLGVTFDKHLTFQNHADLVGLKVSGFLRMLSTRRAKLPRNALKLVVNAYVSSRLLYAIAIVGMSSILRKRFQLLQNFAIRTIFGVPKFSRVSLLRGWLGWSSIEVLASYRFAVLIYKSINGFSPPYLQIRLGDYASSRQSTSRSGNLICPYFANNYGRKKFDVRLVRFYNGLTDKSLWTHPFNEFKRKLLQELTPAGDIH
jgi:hypothetical protein